MVYGIISDIHSNLEALEKVLEQLCGVEAYLCLGDLVGYGPNPNECTQLISQLSPCTCVVGNHDLAAIGKYDIGWFNWHAREAILWTRQQLTPETKGFLTALPEVLVQDPLTLVHGSLPDPMEYITSPWETRLTFAKMTTPICLIGHTHVAEYYVQREGESNCQQVPLTNGGEITLEEGLRYIVNCGAVGQPRDGNPQASFGIYDTEAKTITIKRVEYPIEVVQKKMTEVGLPQFEIMRLALGR